MRGRPLAASAGVAVSPLDGVEPSELLANGDAALYWAKRTGRGRTVRYVAGAVRPEAQQRHEVAALLEQGPSALRIVFQPVVELATGRPAGYEALTRFEDRARPGRVVRAGAPGRAGGGAGGARAALRPRRGWPARGNVPRLERLAARAALRSCALGAPDDLTGIVVELTEHELFGAEGELEAELAALRARGARVALDDAGAGYAGLQQIIRIAPDILKLDRALVHGAHADGSRQALLEALIGFAGTTGAAVCAEGVEDLDDLRALVALDVTYAQGYGLARPGPPWPAPLPGATAAGASEIRAGLRVSIAPRGVAGAFASGMADLSDDLAAATTIADLDAAIGRAAGILRADDVALMQVERDTDSLVLLSAHHANPAGARWPLADFPATRYVLDSRVPGQVVVGDEAGDPAELAELEALGMATVLIVPIVYGGRELAVLEVYRVLPQAFTAREVDRARVLSQQFGAALDRLT